MDQDYARELYQAVFDVYDHTRTGLMDPVDLHDIAKAMNKDPT